MKYKNSKNVGTKFLECKGSSFDLGRFFLWPTLGSTSGGLTHAGQRMSEKKERSHIIAKDSISCGEHESKVSGYYPPS